MALIALPTNFLLSLTPEEMGAIRNALVDWGGLWADETFPPDSVDGKRQERSRSLRVELLDLIEGALLEEHRENQERFYHNLQCMGNNHA